MVAFNFAKEIKHLFTGTCTIYNITSVEDEKFITRQEFVAVKENIPCRLSHRSNNASSKSDVGTSVQEVKLFLLNDVEVKAGSRIEVKQNGVVRMYKYSGICSVYTNHQELIMESEHYV